LGSFVKINFIAIDWFTISILCELRSGVELELGFEIKNVKKSIVYDRIVQDYLIDYVV